MRHCVLCGRPTSDDGFAEEVDGKNYRFDSMRCVLVFKKLHSVYGSEFMAEFVSQDSSLQ